MVFEGYLELGGAEVLNSARAVGYTNTAPCPVGWLQCPPCDGVRDVLGDDIYTYETIFDAPWYDPDSPATSRFLGAHALTIEGVPDSTREAGVAEAILDGGVVGRVRNRTRRMRVRAVLSAIGEDALEAGFAWLDKALRPGRCGMHADACGAADSRFFVACPPERADITMPDQVWNDPVTNLATNPSFEAAAGTVEVYRNLATNPSFEMTSGTVEVRRNLVQNPVGPNAAVASGWVAQARWYGSGAGAGNTTHVTGATDGPTRQFASYIRKTWTVVPTATSDVSFSLCPSTRVAVVAGEVYTVSLWWRRSWASTMNVNNQFAVNFWDAASGGTQVGSSSGTRAADPGANTWQRITHTFTVPAGATFADVYHNAYFEQNAAVGSTLDATGFLVEKSPILGSYFDGASRPRLRENLIPNPAPASATGYGAAGGATVTYSAAKAAVEVVPASANAQSGTSLYGAPSSGLTATVRIDLESELGDSYQITGTGGWGGVIANVTLAAGEKRTIIAQKAMSSSTGNLYAVRTNAGTSGKFWVSKTLLEFAATAGDYFDGATADAAGIGYEWSGTANASPSYAYDLDLTPAWTGTANASASVMNGVGVAGVTHFAGRAVISSTYPKSSGSKSLRIIPTGTAATSTNGAVVFTPVLGKVYTALATVHLLAAQTGSPDADARRIIVGNQGNVQARSSQAPNAPGAYPLSLTFTGDGVNPIRLTNGAAAGNGDVWWDDLLVVEGEYDGAYFDGATPLMDGDLTTVWTGTAHASASVVNGVGVAGVAAGVAVGSTSWVGAGARSLRAMPVSTSSDVDILAVPAVTAGKTFTLLATVRSEETLLGAPAIGVRTYNGSSPEAKVAIPLAPGVNDLRLTFVASPGTTNGSIRLWRNNLANEIWVDSIMLIEGDYAGTYFDGATPDSDAADYEIVGKQLEEYAWTGAANASTSTYRTGLVVAVPDPVEYEKVVERLVRTLHSVTCVSGPIVEQKFHRGDTWGYVVEFVLVAAVPFMFGITKPVAFTPSIPIVVQDVPFNLVPYPSAELAEGTVVAATNFSTNPSLEVGITGWSPNSAVITPAPTPSQGNVASDDLAASGTRSYKMVVTTTNAGSAGTVYATHDVTLPTYVAGQRFSVSTWIAALVTGGTAVASGVRLKVEWRDGAGIIRTDTIGTGAAGGGAIAGKSILRPAGSTIARIVAIGDYSSWSVGAVLAVFVDAVAVTVP